MQSNGHANGLLAAAAPIPADSEPKSRDKIESELMSDGPAAFYRPSLPVQAFTTGDNFLPPLWRFYQDLPAMLAHDRVSQAMTLWKAGVANAEFEVVASAPEVAAFVESEISRFWELSLDQIQRGDEWGWAGCQVYYTIEDGLLHTTHLEAFESRDVRPLIYPTTGEFVGMRVRSNGGGWDGQSGQADLHGAGHSPPKCFWYTHQKHKGMYVGRAQPYEAWRPWSRLAARDGAEEIIDAAVYRYGYRGDIVYFPPDDQEAKRQAGNKPGIQANRDKALEIGEGIKAGSPIALSSATYPNTSDKKWSIERDSYVLDVDPLLNYELALNKKIDAGIGVPSELIEASETGSGYSGRAIPLEGYYQGQQTVATAKVQQWKEQIGDPLVKWNFGKRAWFRITVKPLLETRRKSAAAGQQPANPGMPGQGGGFEPPSPAMPGAGDPPPQQQMATREPQPSDMSGGSGPTIETPPEHAEAEMIAREAATMLSRLNATARDEIAAAVAKGSESEKLAAVQSIMERHKIAFARLLTGARLAALLVAMRRVASGLPAETALAEAPAAPDAIDELLAEAIGAQAEALWAPSLEALPVDRRERVLAILQERSRSIAANPPGGGGTWTVSGYDGDDSGDITFPLIDAAVADLRSRMAITREQFDALAADAKQEAFTVAGIESEAAIAKVRDTLADLVETGPTLPEFKRRVQATVGSGTFLSDAHAETVYRTNTIKAYGNGQEEILKNPYVVDLFPYRAIYPTHDSRTRPWHLALEKSGIDGTNIYNADDPVWKKIRPPSDYGCRCLGSPRTVAQAAAAGVREAQEWKATGRPPENPTFVSLPANWQQSAGFERMATATVENIREAASKVHPDPSPEQKEAGNYRKGHLVWNGLPIAIETAKGQRRKPEHEPLLDHYGYIKRTESEADGDPVDVFLCEDHPCSEIVFVVNQQKADGSFDEHKCILGQACESDAKAAYLRNYPPGWKCGEIVGLTIDQFKEWIECGDTSKPLTDDGIKHLATAHAPAGSSKGGQFVSGPQTSGNSHAAELAKITPGDRAIIAGHSVRRLLDGSFRLETDKHHVTGTADAVAERIQRNLDDQKPDRKRADAALARAEAYDEPNPFTDAERSDADAAALRKVPNGARAVSLDPETHGRLGTIKRETDDNGLTVVRLYLDGTPDVAATDFEPLDPKHSWRSGEKPAANPAAPQQLTLFATNKADRGGRWITIGGQKGEDGKRHGGSPVFIDANGRITKGHPKLTGKSVAALKEEDGEPEQKQEQKPAKSRGDRIRDAWAMGFAFESPEHRDAEWNKRRANWHESGGTNEAFDAEYEKLYGGAVDAWEKEQAAAAASVARGDHRRELNQSKAYQRAVYAKQARQQGIDPKQLHQLAAEVMAHDWEFKREKLAMLREARSMMGGVGKSITTHLRSGAIEDEVKSRDLGKGRSTGFDETAEWIHKRYAAFFPKTNRGEMNADDELREHLTEGNPQKMSEEDAYGQAMEMLLENKTAWAKTDDDEQIPFATTWPTYTLIREG